MPTILCHWPFARTVLCRLLPTGVQWAFEPNEDEGDRGKWLDVGLAHLLKNSTAETALRISAQLAHLQSADSDGEVLCPQFELTLKRITQTPGKTPRGGSRASDTPAPRQPSFGAGDSRASRASARTARGTYQEEDGEESGNEEEEEDGDDEEEARRPTAPHAPQAPHTPHAPPHAPHVLTAGTLPGTGGGG